MPVTLPPPFYENQNPGYRNYIIEIEACLNAKNFKGDKLLDVFRRFIQSNMLSKEVWYALFVLFEDRGLIWEAIARFEIPSMYQLYYPQDNLGLFSHFGYGYFLKRKLVGNPRKYVLKKWKEMVKDNCDEILAKDVQLLIENVTYPHPDLKKIWQCYEKNVCSTPPKELVERYQKYADLYEKLVTVDGSDEEWLELILEADDVDFVKHNFEYILGSELDNKNIWNMYLSFLQKHDIDTMLQTYSKYCRLFRDDTEMKEKYQNAVKKHREDGILTVPWTDTFCFEKYDELFFAELYNQVNRSNPASPVIEHQPLSIHFTADNSVRQNFSFKNSVINYIQQNASPAVQLKLSFMCKYFYLRKPTFICHSLKIDVGENQYFQQAVHFNTYGIDEYSGYLYNIYLTTVLYCDGADRKCLSKLIEKMQKCTAKYLTIIDQDLTLKEFKFLVGHGNVVELNMIDSNIVDGDNGKQLHLEDIISLMPSIERISGDNIPTNKETLTKLLNVPFTSKFDKILLKSVIVSHFNPEQVIEFLKKNVATDCDVAINFLLNVNTEEEIDLFAHTVYFGIWGFWKGSERPSFRLLP
uniref:Uncharacterized protein n=1 Tax=Panagrolaimus sp. ES5 TaxID=591445 RepID=A0AC34F833_9BILA